MKKKLYYTDFRTAGIRNLTTCKYLLRTLLECDAVSQKHIQHKIYYLSGYIIEFALKFALFSHLGVSRYQNLYEYLDEDFMKKWREHDFQKLKYLCSSQGVNFSSDIPYLGHKIDQKIENLVKSYDVQVRYSISLAKQRIELDIDILTDFHNFSDKLFKQITSKYS